MRPYYGWVIVAALSFTELTSYGVLVYAFAVFVVPMQEELGWSRATISGAYSLAIVVSGIAAVPVGRLLDRHGPRVIMSLGSCAAAALVFAWSRVEDLVMFYVIWAGIGVAMAMVLYEPAFAATATWFREDLDRAVLALTARSARPSETSSCAPPQSLPTSVTSRRSRRSRNSATSRTIAPSERSASGRIGRR